MGSSTGGLLTIFPTNLKQLFEHVLHEEEHIREIRLRVHAPVLISMGGEEIFLTESGKIEKDIRKAKRLSCLEMEEIMQHICHDSVYAYEEEIKKGFLTLPGGHRVGIAGEVVLNDLGEIKTIKNISCLNIRIAHEMMGAADSVMNKIYQEGRVQNTLIISPPGCGKTTLLRDMIRQVSNGTSYGSPCQVGVVDERSEIAGCYHGVAQKNVGERTDILDACPKKLGMMMMLRSMAPQVMAIDELGGTEDVEALLHVVQSGCAILVTIHGDNVNEIKNKCYLQELFREKVFRRFILLSRKGNDFRIEQILNEDFEKC